MLRLCEPHLFYVGSPNRFPAGIPATDVAAEPQTLSHISAFDVVFYNLGNDVRQHAWIFDIARVHAGIVVLHEVSLHRFFLGYYLQHLRRPDLYIARMAEHYGITGLTAAHRAVGPWFDPESAQVADDDLLHYQFTEEALRSARGSVVHSRWHGAIVRKQWRGPVCETWLPAQRPTASSIPSSPHGDELDRTRITLITLGPVEPRARVAEVINLLGEDRDLAARTRYVIVGAYDPADPYVHAVTAKITGSGLADTVHMLGDLPPHEVDRWARVADVFINLHNPDEGCPMSLMYELPFGTPVVINDGASYAEVPNDAVVKIATGDTAGLQASLRELVDSAALREAIGTAGKRFADRHTARDYARELLRFANQNARLGGPETRAQARVPDVAERIAIHVGETLSNLGATSHSPGVEAAIREAGRLLCPPAL
jgi:Glycosyl transferases group 1